MNRVNYDQTEGFPVDANVLDFHQNATQIFNKFGELAGNCSIISGCVETGENVSDGVVYVNGEAFDFKGGQKTEFVIIRQTAVNLPFENGAMKPVEITRFVTFGNDGVTNIPWANFKKPKTLLQLNDEKAPKDILDGLVLEVAELKKKAAVFQEGGGMVLWNKPANLIPAGWAEVVNWRGRMPIGVDPNDLEFETLGITGGDKNYRLTEQNIPKIDLRDGKHKYLLKIADGHNQTNSVFDNTGIGYEPDVSTSGIKELKTFGSDLPVAINIMNPFRTVLFIEYVG